MAEEKKEVITDLAAVYYQKAVDENYNQIGERERRRLAIGTEWSLEQVKKEIKIEVSEEASNRGLGDSLKFSHSNEWRTYQENL